LPQIGTAEIRNRHCLRARRSRHCYWPVTAGKLQTFEFNRYKGRNLWVTTKIKI
jgi:hypothetical protein